MALTTHRILFYSAIAIITIALMIIIGSFLNESTAIIIFLIISLLLIGWGVLKYRRNIRLFPKFKEHKIPSPKKTKLPEKLKSPKAPLPPKGHKAKLR